LPKVQERLIYESQLACSTHYQLLTHHEGYATVIFLICPLTYHFNYLKIVCRMVQNRRSFFKQSSAIALGTALLGGQALDALALGRPKNVGLQLFTLFNVIDEDVKGSLKKVADIGYKEVESAFSRKGGYYGLTPKEFATALKEVGLTWRSHHVGGAPARPRPGMNMGKRTNLKEDAQKVIDEVAEGGVKYLVCSSIPIDTIEDVKEGIEILQKSGELAKKAGITLAYHNHEKEFKSINGQMPYDMFLSQISADVMKMELDLAWVSKAGVDPVALFKQHPKRFPLWHVKDMDKEFTTLKPVGEGVIDFKRIFENSKKAGLEHFFVEHDMPANAFESIATSMNTLKTKILK
jgi:sugar phosphate isomerase/epimerase